MISQVLTVFNYSSLVLLSGWIADRLSTSRTVIMALGLTGAAVVLMGIGPRSLLITASTCWQIDVEDINGSNR